MQDMIFTFLAFYISWALLFPQSFGRHMREHFDRIRKGWGHGR